MVAETYLPVEPGGGPPSFGNQTCPDGSIPDNTGMCPDGSLAGGTTPLPPVTGEQGAVDDCPPWAPGCPQPDGYNPCQPGMERDATGNCVPSEGYDFDAPCPQYQTRGVDGYCHPDPGDNSPPIDPGTGQPYPDDDPGSPTYTGGGVNPDIPGNTTVLPDVSPYDVSDSRDWMNIFDYGGENSNVNAINPNANPMAYEDINQFTDAAFQNSMRQLEPQMELQDDRFAQELINKGIDPNSEAGKKALKNKQMGQNDLLSKSAFDAMGFGTGIQNQMFGQDAMRSQLANAMLQSQMGLSQRGHEFDTTTGMNANDQAFGQMMGLEGLNYRDYLTGVDQSRYQDSLSMALAGLAPPPGFQTFNTGLPQAPVYEYGQQSGYNNNLYNGSN